MKYDVFPLVFRVKCEEISSCAGVPWPGFLFKCLLCYLCLSCDSWIERVQQSVYEPVTLTQSLSSFSSVWTHVPVNTREHNNPDAVWRSASDSTLRTHSGRFDPEDIQLKNCIEFSKGIKLCKCIKTLKIHIIFFINYVLRDISI